LGAADLLTFFVIERRAASVANGAAGPLPLLIAEGFTAEGSASERAASRLAVSESEELMRALDEMTRRLH
jgi:hypothetical protein